VVILTSILPRGAAEVIGHTFQQLRSVVVVTFMILIPNGIVAENRRLSTPVALI